MTTYDPTTGMQNTFRLESFGPNGMFRVAGCIARDTQTDAVTIITQRELTARERDEVRLHLEDLGLKGPFMWNEPK